MFRSSIFIPQSGVFIRESTLPSLHSQCFMMLSLVFILHHAFFSLHSASSVLRSSFLNHPFALFLLPSFFFLLNASLFIIRLTLFRWAPGCVGYETFVYPWILHAVFCKALYTLSAAMLSDYSVGRSMPPKGAKRHSGRTRHAK